MYHDIKPNDKTGGVTLVTSGPWIAYTGRGGGGPVEIIHESQFGRSKGDRHKLTVHKGTVLDMQFSPFSSDMLATASADGYAKISIIPSEMKETLKKESATLKGHEKKVNLVRYHPNANYVIGTGSYDKTVKIWDLEKQCEILSHDVKDIPQSMEWSRDGKYLAVFCKDYYLRVFDPRTKGPFAIAKGPTGKQSNVQWTKNNRIFVAGSRSNMGMYTRVYNIFQFASEGKSMDLLHNTEVDKASGVLTPFFDYDTGVMFVSGKGDTSIRYNEIVPDKPYCHFLSTFQDSAFGTINTCAWTPKRYLDTTKCEIAKALVLYRSSGSEKIVPVSFQVPRKSDLFQRDLFPDTYAGKPALSADAWLKGENKMPILCSMKPEDNNIRSETVSSFKAKKSPDELQADLSKALARIKELEAQVARLSR